MKKVLLILIISLFWFNNVISQNEIVVTTINIDSLTTAPLKLNELKLDCDYGNNLAIIDFNNQIYKVFAYSLVRDENEKIRFEKYRKYLSDKFNIKVIDRGCVHQEYEKCYSESMSELLKIKFGNKIFEKAKTKSISEN